MNLTDHATERLNQRGIPQSVVDIVLECGAMQPAPGGATKIFFGKRERYELISRLKKTIKLIERANGICLVVKEDAVLTVYRKN